MSHFRNIFSFTSSTSRGNNNEQQQQQPITITCDDTPQENSCNDLGIVYDNCPICAYNQGCQCPECTSDNYEITVDGRT